MPVADLLLGAERERFLLVADHQPVDVEENASEGVDLLLSGHTHAGQIFPVGYLIDLSGGMRYGLYRKGACRVIVSSGEAGWGFPIRTQGKCEYVVVHLRPGSDLSVLAAAVKAEDGRMPQRSADGEKPSIRAA